MRTCSTPERAARMCRWKGNHRFRYLLYKITKDIDRKNTAALEYGNSIQREVQNERELLSSDVHHLYISNEKDCSDKNVSKNKITLKMIGKVDENSVTDVWSDYSEDSTVEKN